MMIKENEEWEGTTGMNEISTSQLLNKGENCAVKWLFRCFNICWVVGYGGGKNSATVFPVFGKRRLKGTGCTD